MSQSLLNLSKSLFGESKQPSEERLLKYFDGLIANAYTYLCYSLVRFRQNSFVKGGYDIRKSWVFFRDADAVLNKLNQYGYTTDPKVVGLLHFGLGVFHFFVSITPPHLMWIVKLLGFEPDKDLSIKELTEARESECTKSIEASLVLYGLKRYFTEEEAKADSLLVQLKEEYPNSAVVHYLNGLVLRMKGCLSEGITDLKEAKKKMHMEQMRVTLGYHLATSNMLISNYSSAKKYFKKFLDNNTGKYFRTWSAFQIGLCNLFSEKDLEEVTPMFKSAIKWKKDKDPYDEYAARKCKEYIKLGGFSVPELSLLKAQLLHEAKRFEECLKELEGLPEKLNPKDKTSNDKLALYHFFSGSCYKGLRNFTKAKEHLKKAVILEGSIKKEKYAVPHAYVDLGEIAIEENELDLASTFLKKAKDYSDYDWQTFLNIYLLAALNKVKRLQDEQKADKSERSQERTQEEPTETESVSESTEKSEKSNKKSKEKKDKESEGEKDSKDSGKEEIQ